MRVHFANVGGVRARYYRAGEGPPVILIHGGGAAADTWARNIEPLADHATVFAPDLIGHGFTEGIDFAGRVPQEVQLEHVKAFCAELNLGSVVLVGSAFGALVAALAYLDDPELVSGLVLVGSASVFHPPEGQTGMIQDAVANQTAALANPTREAIRKRNVGSNYDKGDTFEEIVLLQMTAFAQPDRLDVYRWMTEGMRATADTPEWRVQHRLEDLALPTLVITGRDDPRASSAITAEQAARLPNAQLCVFDQCGHKPFSEQSERFNREVGAFLDRLAAS